MCDWWDKTLPEALEDKILYILGYRALVPRRDKILEILGTGHWFLEGTTY